MNTNKHLPEDQLVEKGVSALLSALGWVDAMRFLYLNRDLNRETLTGGDYTEERRAWQEQLDEDVYLDELFGVME